MGNGKALILIVDDNPANLRIGKIVLKDKYTVATADSVDIMNTILEKNRPDLILLDVNMPGKDGYDAIRLLKSNPGTKDIPVIFLTASTDASDELMGLSLGAVDYISKPIQPVLLLKRIELHMLIDEQGKTLKQQAIELKNFNENLQNMVNEKTQNIVELQNALLRTMAELVEYRDDITGKHIERTQRGLKILLNEMQKNSSYSKETEDWDIDLLIQSCQLHDVGKIYIRDSILRKPGKLSQEEFEDIKIHAQIGKQIVEKVEKMTKENDFLKYAKIFASSHHEKWDGTGYPCGLKGKDIPLLGRAMAIADVYDALISVRPYKNGFSHEEAVEIISKGRGNQFDPELVDIFIRVSDEFRKNCEDNSPLAASA